MRHRDVGAITTYVKGVNMTGKVAVGVVALVFLGAGFMAGCGDGVGGRAGDKKEIRAKYIEDGAPKYFPEQRACPVCGKGPLFETHHVDVDGKRIYFDSEECVEKFKENKSQYVSKIDKRKEQAESPIGPGI